MQKVMGSLLAAFLMFSCHSNTAFATQSLRSQQTITLEAALEIAQIALKASRANGATNVAIAVVDSAARPLVVLRDDNAPEHPLTAAERKAWTAANYQSSTKDVLERIKKDDGDDGELVYTRKSLFLMGGVPLRVDNSVVGAIGVAGNPSGFQDDEVATKAANAFKQMLSEKNSTP
jgi:uncharacterized protein GlcG (DUF336 family)